MSKSQRTFDILPRTNHISEDRMVMVDETIESNGIDVKWKGGTRRGIKRNRGAEVEETVVAEAEEDVEEWEVEGIIDSKVKAGTFLYKVRWSGPYGDTWQPPCDLDCYALVNAFHTSKPEKPKPEARELQRMIRRTTIEDRRQ